MLSFILLLTLNPVFKSTSDHLCPLVEASFHEHDTIEIQD